MLLNWLVRLTLFIQMHTKIQTHKYTAGSGNLLKALLGHMVAFVRFLIYQNDKKMTGKQQSKVLFGVTRDPMDVVF